MNYLLDKLKVELADLPLERITELGFQQRTVDYTGDWVTTATMNIDLELVPDRDTFYGVVWSFVCSLVAATESRSCRVLVTTLPGAPERTEPAQVKGEIDTRGPREKLGVVVGALVDGARRRTDFISRLSAMVGVMVGVGGEVDERRQHSDPNVRVLFPLPLANIRMHIKRQPPGASLTRSLIVSADTKEVADFAREVDADRATRKESDE